MPSPRVVRRGEYAARGDYHRTPDPSWDYYPTYLAKLELSARYLTRCRRHARARCGLRRRRAGRRVRRPPGHRRASTRTTRRPRAHGSLMALPSRTRSFDRALCLDVLEHLTYEEQPRALAELFRVLRPGGELLVSIPNLAHLQSRIHFLLRGRLIRTASEYKHPATGRSASTSQLGRARRIHARRRARHLPDGSDPHAPDPAPSAGAARRCTAG